MARRSKQAATADKRAGPDRSRQAEGTEPDSFLVPAHPPAQNRPLLIVSIVLFVLWLLFLLYNALLGPL